MAKTYSFKIGFYKGLLSLFTIAGSITALVGFNDVNIFDFIVNQIKPIIGTLTVGGAITVAINYIKFKLTA